MTFVEVVKFMTSHRTSVIKQMLRYKTMGVNI